MLFCFEQVAVAVLGLEKVAFSASPRRLDALPHQAHSGKSARSHSCRKGNVADGDDFEHSHERKVEGPCALAEDLLHNFLTKKMKVNEGEVPQYYVENSHPAIVEPEVFDLVRRNWREGSNPAEHTAARAALRESSCAAVAASSTGARCGTPRINTAASSGSATANSKEGKSAIRHTSPKR